MPRSKKDVVEYFSHSVNSLSEKAVKVLRHKFGNDGYVTWFVLKEALGRSDGHYLDLRSQDDYDLQAADCGVDERQFDAILSYLATRGYIDNDLWLQKIVWMADFVKELALVYNKRKRPAPEAPVIGDIGRNGIKVPDTGVTGDDIPITGDKIPQRKGKESIVEDSIVEDSIVEDVGGGGPLPDAKMSEKDYELLINTYFVDIEKEKIVLKRWGKEYPHVDIKYQLGKAKKWLIKNITNRKPDIGGWVEDVWLSNAEDDARPKVGETLPDGVPSFAEFLLEVNAYKESVNKTGMYNNKLMCPFTSETFVELFGGTEALQTTSAGYLNKALKVAYDMGLELRRKTEKAGK